MNPYEYNFPDFKICTFKFYLRILKNKIKITIYFLKIKVA